MSYANQKLASLEACRWGYLRRTPHILYRWGACKLKRFHSMAKTIHLMRHERNVSEMAGSAGSYFPYSFAGGGWCVEIIQHATRIIISIVTYLLSGIGARLIWRFSGGNGDLCDFLEDVRFFKVPYLSGLINNYPIND